MIDFMPFERAMAELIRREKDLDYEITVEDISYADREEWRYSEYTADSLSLIHI